MEVTYQKRMKRAGETARPRSRARMEALMIDREYFTLVFKGDIGKLKLNPMNTETVFGRPVAAGRGNAFDEADNLREQIARSPQEGAVPHE